jgi:hypothetical protein
MHMLVFSVAGEATVALRRPIYYALTIRYCELVRLQATPTNKVNKVIK